MQNSADSKQFAAKDDDPSGLAQPKGIQTRSALQKHLAKKLKIDVEDAKDPNMIAKSFAQYAFKNEGVGKTYWDIVIQNARENTVIARMRKKQMLIDEQFHRKQNEVKHRIDEMIKEQQAIRHVQKGHQVKDLGLELSAEENSGDEGNNNSFISDYARTQDLAALLKQNKD